jgi:polysaccharide biosynthesis/export protein
MAKRNAGMLMRLSLNLIWAVCLCFAGCFTSHCQRPVDMPNEWQMEPQPEYRISPPDILVIDALGLIPRPPYKIAPLDGLVIRLTVINPGDDKKPNELLPRQPIDGIYRVEADGNVNLGFDYGSVRIGHMTIPEAQNAVTEFLKQRFKVDFLITVALFESRALQQIRGEHLVRQDGKVTLGMYGGVFVAGMTVEEAKAAIQKALSGVLLDPEISIDVAGYNSQVYYIIIDLAGAGEQVYRFPITGSQTVLDAIGEIRGLPGGTDRKRIVLARPSAPDQPPEATTRKHLIPAHQTVSESKPCYLVYPVDWEAITRCGSTATNFQIFPGDRIYVAVDRWIALDNCLAKIISPIERIFGIVLLGSSTVQQVSLPLGAGATGAATGTGAVSR